MNRITFTFEGADGSPRTVTLSPKQCSAILDAVHNGYLYHAREETQRALVRRGLVDWREDVHAYGRLNADGRAAQRYLNTLERDLDTGALIFPDQDGRNRK